MCVHSLECVFHCKRYIPSWSLSPYQHTAAQPTKEIYPNSPQQDRFPPYICASHSVWSHHLQRNRQHWSQNRTRNYDRHRDNANVENNRVRAGPATYFPQDLLACIRIITSTARISRITSTSPRRPLLRIPTTVSSRTQDELECECVDRPILKRENDLFLMDKVCAKPKEELSDAKVRTINNCINYLEVKRLSDICTADGQFIIALVWDGTRSVTQS